MKVNFKIAPLPAATRVIRGLLAWLVLSERALAGEPTEAPEVTDAESAVDDVLEVTVFSASPAEQLRKSAYVVTVVETETAQREGGDLGDVLARRSPVSVQRASGLGSRTNLSLGGLGGERLRFFVDGVPLGHMGYLAGPANVPVNLVDRIDVFQGTVPVQLAGDALGGAVNLVTDDALDGSRVAASYQLGSYGTHRAALSGRLVHLPSGLFVRADGFYDVADNDYPVDVSAYDSVGRITDGTVRRFHGGYQGRGATVGVGLADRSWADRLVLQGFYADYHNDLQHGATMARPYGEVTFDRRTAGTNLTYDVGRGGATELRTVAGYAYLDARFLDRSSCIYDWYGICTPRANEAVTGEINGTPEDRQLLSHTVFLRTTLQHRFHPSHRFRLALATTHTSRLGSDRTLSAENDALSRPRRLTTAVFGAELESNVWDGRIANVASVKGYFLHTGSEALLATGDWKDMSATLPSLGGGETVRLRLVDGLYAKASYEYATRQPTVDELYGDGMLVLENLELRPERSHNVNAGLRLEPTPSPIGAIQAGLQGFARYSHDLITQLAQNDQLKNVNVWNARVFGLESRLGWKSPGDWLALEGRATWQDLRNVSSEGDLAERSGDRIPNTPYLFGSASARFHADRLVVPQDSIELGLTGRYVHAFFLGWESYALSAERLTVPSQLTFGLAATYVLRGDRRTSSFSFGVENLTDADVFDFYAVQRPGRTFYAKWTLR